MLHREAWYRLVEYNSTDGSAVVQSFKPLGQAARGALGWLLYPGRNCAINLLLSFPIFFGVKY